MLPIRNNAVQLCVGNKTCYRPNILPEMVNHYSSTSLLKYHETFSTLFIRKICNHYIPQILKTYEINVLKLCPHQRKFLLSNFDTRDWNLDLINLVNCWNNWLHQKKLLEALKGKCFWNILLLELNNLLFEQFTVYCLNNLLFERFTVKCLNTLIFTNCMILRNILYSPEDQRHRETQSCNLENNVSSGLSSQWLCGNSCTWVHNVRLHMAGTNEPECSTS